MLIGIIIYLLHTLFLNFHSLLVYLFTDVFIDEVSKPINLLMY